MALSADEYNGLDTDACSMEEVRDNFGKADALFDDINTRLNSVGAVIDSGTASNSSALEFKDDISSTYVAYEIVLTSIIPATDAVNLLMEVSTDGGSTWKTGSNYNIAGVESDFAGSMGGYSSAGASSFQLTSQTMSNVSSEGCTALFASTILKVPACL